MAGQRLVLVHGDRRIILAPGVLFIGRGEDVDLPLDDDRVSRRHAAIRVSLHGIAIEDLRSRNGVFVNGEPVFTVRDIGAGDVITIGNQEIRLEAEEREGTSTADAATVQSGRLVRPRHRKILTPLNSVRALGKLSPREQEVLRLLAGGFNQREIGESLGLSVKTVETYRARIADKLDLRTRADLVRYAVDIGILRPQ